MLKEIHDQPRALADTFRGRISLKDGQVALEDIQLSAAEVKQIKRFHLVACGTAWHACLVGKFMLEEIAGIPAEVDYGSEFRYRSPLMDPKSVLLMVSQSGETADTLAASGYRARQESQDSLRLQRHRCFDPAQIPWRALHPCRTGDQRGQHQGIHDPIDRALSCWPWLWGGSTANSARRRRKNYCAI